MLITLPWSLTDVPEVVKTLSHSPCLLSAEVKQGDTLSFYFRSHTANKCPVCAPDSIMFFTLLCFFGVVLLFKMTSESRAKVLWSTTEPRKAVTGLMLDRLRSSM